MYRSTGDLFSIHRVSTLHLVFKYTWSTLYRVSRPHFQMGGLVSYTLKMMDYFTNREDSVELYHSLMYTTVFVEVYQCVCRSIPYSILQLIPTKLGGNQLQNTVWCMYGILLQTHWYSGIVLQIVV